MPIIQIFKTILFLVIMTLYAWVSPTPAMAQSCGGDCSVAVCSTYCIWADGVCHEQDVYCSNCGGNGCQTGICPAGQYMANGGCRPIGENLDCGEWYDCPTPNNPSKMCKVECGGGGDNCRAGKVDCAPGYVKTSTVASTTCSVVNNQSLCGGIGSAQTSFSNSAANCCKWVTIAAEYSDWFCGDDPGPKGQTCGFKANGSEKCCKDEISPEYSYCSNALIRTYECVVNCDATAPTGVNASQGTSATSASVTWTSGTNGVSQKLYVGTDQTKVNANCPLNDCYINGTTLSPFYASTNYSYPVTGLTPSTPYYFRVVTYKASTCTPGMTAPVYNTPANNTITERLQ